MSSPLHSHALLSDGEAASPAAAPPGENPFIRMEAVLDCISDAIIVLDPRWRIVFINRSYLALVEPLGHSAESLLGATFWEKFPEMAGAPVAGFYRAVMSGQQPGSHELYYEPIRTWLEVRAFPSREGLTLCLRDISPQKEAERELKQRSERMQLLSEALAQLLSAVNPDTVVRELFAKVAAHLKVDTCFNFMVNEKGDALVLHSCAGIPPEALPSVSTIQFGDSICGMVAQSRQAMVVTDIQHSTCENFRVVRDFGIQAYACNPLVVGERLLGTLSFGSRTRTSFEEDELEFLRVVSQSTAVALDRLKQAEEVRQSEMLYRAIGESIDYGVWICNEEGRNLYVSESFLKLLGISQARCSEFGWKDSLHPDDAEATIEAWKACVASGGFWEREHRFKGLDGKWHPMLARGVPVRDAEGRVVRWVGINLDISTYKRHEEALASQKRCLEILNRAAGVLSSELRMDRLAQALTDAGHEATGAAVGAFFQPQAGPGRRWVFSKGTQEPEAAAEWFAEIEKSPLFEEVLGSGGTVRSYGDSAASAGLPPWRGALPAMGSLLATPIVSRSGRVAGALFFGRQDSGGFSEESEWVLSGIATQAAAAIDSASLYDHVQKTADRLSLAMAAGKLGDWSWDSRTDLVHFSAGAAAMFGFSETFPMTWQAIREFIHSEDREAARAAVEKAVLDRIDCDMEYRVNRTDGTQTWVASRGRITLDDEGAITGMRGVVQDITERKRSGEALAALSEKIARQAHLFDATLSHIADLACTFDCQGRVIYANRPLLELWGLTLEEAIGKTCHDLNYPLDLADRMTAGFLAVAATGRPLKGEIEYTSSSGVRDFHEYIYNPVFDTGGNVVAIAGTTRLITERKRAENELKEAKEAAEAASRAKDRFLAVLSHELRTPLNPVLMTVTTLEADPHLPAALREDLTMIRRNVELETKLIDDLLDLNRITSGKLRLQLQEVDLNAAIRHVCGICQDQVLEKRIRLRCELDEASPALSADPARLQQVLWNVLKNAIKFTPVEGEVFVSTRLREPGMAEVQVRDTGIGMPHDILDRIFEAFEQGDTQITRRFGGLGLGLAISKALVDLHHGVIRAESPGEGRGATLTLSLPLHRREAGQSPGGGASGPWPVSDKASTRLLIAEDHVDTARILERFLSKRGFSVAVAHTVAAALRLAEARTFDILVSDIGLPDASGHDLMRQITALQPVKGIAISGYGMEEDVERSRRAGFHEHLTKPVSIDQLQEAIRRVLKQA